MAQPSRDRNGEGSYDWGMNHQKTRSANGVEVAAWRDSMTRQRREGEANGSEGQRPARASRTGSSWTEFVRLAHQVVVAFAGVGIINRAEPRACGHSRGPRRPDSEPGTERTAGAASNASRQRRRKGAASNGWCFQPYRGKLAVRDDERGVGETSARPGGHLPRCSKEPIHRKPLV